MISKVELLHHRLQAVLREHTFSGDNSLEYLGEDERGHKYSIAGNEVYVCLLYTSPSPRDRG